MGCTTVSFLFSVLMVLVGSGMLNKISQTGIYFSWFWRLGCRTVQFLVRALFQACRRLPSQYVLRWTFFSVCVQREISLPLFIRPPVLSDQDLILMTSVNLNYLPKALSPNTITFHCKQSERTKPLLQHFAQKSPQLTIPFHPLQIFLPQNTRT